jgi:hypothetical protein
MEPEDFSIEDRLCLFWGGSEVLACKVVVVHCRDGSIVVKPEVILGVRLRRDRARRFRDDDHIL